jgi:hypothetical protein
VIVKGSAVHKCDRFNIASGESPDRGIHRDPWTAGKWKIHNKKVQNPGLDESSIFEGGIERGSW